MVKSKLACSQWPYCEVTVARDYAETAFPHNFHTRKLGEVTVFFAGFAALRQVNPIHKGNSVFMFQCFIQFFCHEKKNLYYLHTLGTYNINNIFIFLFQNNSFQPYCFYFCISSFIVCSICACDQSRRTCYLFIHPQILLVQLKDDILNIAKGT